MKQMGFGEMVESLNKEVPILHLETGASKRPEDDCELVIELLLKSKDNLK